jgi:hypothetical protein
VKLHRVLTLMMVSMAIWGTGALAASPQPAAKSTGQTPHQVYGTIRAIKGAILTLETREKRSVEVDAAKAVKSYRSSVLNVGGTVIVEGPYDAKGVLQAETIQRAKASPATWPADR